MKFSRIQGGTDMKLDRVKPMIYLVMNRNINRTTTPGFNDFGNPYFSQLQNYVMYSIHNLRTVFFVCGILWV